MSYTGNHSLFDQRSGLTGVILAGGQSRRMGGHPKALLSYRSEKLVHRQIRLLRELCSEIIIVANEPRIFLPIVDKSVRIISDYYTGMGPLAGMHAALSLARHDRVWLVGSDMPFISAHAAELMLNRMREGNCHAVIPYLEERLHPLHGIYDKRLAPNIEAELSEGQLRVTDFLEKIIYERVGKESFRLGGIDTRFVLNVNTPEEYELSLVLDPPAEEGMST